jgi:hypothetical protein
VVAFEQAMTAAIAEDRDRGVLAWAGTTEVQLPVTPPGASAPPAAAPTPGQPDSELDMLTKLGRNYRW